MAVLLLIIINLLFPFAALGYLVVFFVSPRKKLLKKLKEELPQRFGLYKNKKLKNIIWVHAASAGEVRSVKTMLPFFRDNYPENPVLVTTSTSLGRETAENFLKQKAVLAPLDFFPLTEKFIKTFKPSKLFIFETEIWPNMLKSCQRHKVPVFLLNARMSDKSAKTYGFIKTLTENILKDIKCLCAQNDEIRKRYISLGVKKERTFVTGNIKYDMLDTHPLYKDKVKGILSGLKWNDKPILVCGSTHLQDEAVILPAFRETKKNTNLKLVLAPRHIERIATVKRQLSEFKINYALLSQLETVKNVDCILVDKMGWLTALYANADICFIGGTIEDKGGHNALEAAALSKPILLGSSVDNIKQEAEKLIAEKGAFVVTKENFRHILGELIENVEFCAETGRNAYRAVVSFQGAVEKTKQLIEKYDC